jgi:uncharacterized membrane protein
MSTPVVVLITLVYPLGVWFGHGRIEPRFLSVLLVLAGVAQWHRLKISQVGRWWLGGTLLLFLLALWSDGLLPLRLYPVMVNAALLSVFIASLINPPSMIERLARIREPNLPVCAINYTRRVTQVWCIFFVANGAIALITALWSSPACWIIYNGVIAYLLMGFLFAGEHVVRSRFKRQWNG